MRATACRDHCHYQATPQYTAPGEREIDMARLKAKVKPDVLIWARESAGYTLEQAAKGLAIEPATLALWEAAEDAPTIPKLRKLADLYKRPLAVLYLPEPPTKFQPMRDFRRLVGNQMSSVSPAIVIEERKARQKRELAVELAKDLDDPIPEFTLSASMTENPEVVGARVRVQLGVTPTLQGSWRDLEGRLAFKGWRDRIESQGVLVLQSNAFSSDEASGFAIWEPVSPVIVVSRKATHLRKRTFSLLHEFAHLLLRASGVSDLEIDGDSRRPPEEQKVEVFCNAVAAAALIPQEELLAQPAVSQHRQDDMEWSDAELLDISKVFGVSREAVLRRLLTFKRTTKVFYQATRERYNDEWDQSRARQRAEAKAEGIPRNMPQEAVSDIGRPLISRLLERYHQDYLSLSEVAGYLGLKAKHVGKIEQMMRRP
jgi:Zn-dependent peptidase ImmA (M78 family)/transcriptional regulator with XRE-family HTH domain